MPANPIRLRRRAFLAGAAAFAGTLWLSPDGRGAAGTKAGPLILEAKPGTASLLENPDTSTAIWGYEGRVPGPVIRARRGDEIWVRLKNALPQPTTIHWHGIRIDNAMDGVAGLTQEAVPPGETFDYRFKVPDAGTFWYHPHNLSWEQVARGLYAPLIVEETEAPDVDQDVVIVADDWRLGEDGNIDEKSFGSIHDRAHAGRLGNVLTLNGKDVEKIAVRAGERIRLRLCSSCNARTLELRFENLDPRVIAIDGQPVTPHSLDGGKLVLASAQRADLLIDMTGDPGSSSAIAEISGERLVAGLFEYHPDKTVKLRESALLLPGNDLPAPDISNARLIDLVMTGGAMSQMEKAIHKGKEYHIRDLVREHGMVWALNGVAGMPEKPQFTARLGETIGLRMVNQTRWPHAMHIHGHHFREAESASGGSAPPWRDTILVDVEETRTVYFVADNPGKWMIHCHMLEHQAGGMGTWFEVSG